MLPLSWLGKLLYMYMKVKKSSVLKSICSCLLSHSKKSSCFWSSSYSPGGFVPISKHFFAFCCIGSNISKTMEVCRKCRCNTHVQAAALLAVTLFGTSGPKWAWVINVLRWSSSNSWAEQRESCPKNTNLFEPQVVEQVRPGDRPIPKLPNSFFWD